MPQSKRLKVLESFKAGKVPVLVATDVAARGIDVDDLAMVVNYDLPNEPENYVHRIGRTARAGKSGKAYTFCSEQDVYNLPAIERYIEMSIPSSVADESMFAEDKSEGIYIRTENWHDDYSENNSGKDYGRKASGYRSRRFDRSENRSFRSAKSGRYDKKQNPGRSRRIETSAEELKQLENLSFDERMKLYKQKYACDSLKNPSSYTERKFTGRQQNSVFSGKKHDRRYDRDFNGRNKKYGRFGNETKNLSSKSRAKGLDSRKNIFSRLLSFLGRGK